MLKKLRVKFIALNMAIVIGVLTVAFVSIVYINYQQNVNAVYAELNSALDMAEKHDAMLPSQDDGTSPSDESAPPQIGGKRPDDSKIIPAAVYLVDAEGDPNTISTFGTASITGDVLAQAVAQALESSNEQDELSGLGLFYVKRSFRDGTLIAFADVSAASWKDLAGTLVGVSVAAVAVFFVVSLFFSRWALRPVERAWSQQQQFIADASHELKTPLTVILANTAILRSHPDSSIAEQTQWVESTQTEAKRMQGLVNDMIDLARPTDPATRQLSFADVDFTYLVESYVLQFESVAFERDIQVESNLEDNLHVRGDAKRLERLVSTLIDNACKYSAAGGLVRVELRQANRNVVFAVHNDGTVIAREDLPHVFDRFYRADKARARDEARDEGSFGLGLAIAQEVAHEHGGSIAATSNEDDGTTFTVTLPQHS